MAARAYRPENWLKLKRQVSTRAGNRCEWCGAQHQRPHPETGALVTLKVDLVRVSGDPEWDYRADNAMALCGPCSWRHNRPVHVRDRRLKALREQRAAGQLELPHVRQMPLPGGAH